MALPVVFLADSRTPHIQDSLLHFLRPLLNGPLFSQGIFFPDAVHAHPQHQSNALPVFLSFLSRTCHCLTQYRLLQFGGSFPPTHPYFPSLPHQRTRDTVMPVPGGTKHSPSIAEQYTKYLRLSRPEGPFHKRNSHRRM